MRCPKRHRCDSSHGQDTRGEVDILTTLGTDTDHQVLDIIQEHTTTQVGLKQLLANAFDPKRRQLPPRVQPQQHQTGLQLPHPKQHQQLPLSQQTGAIPYLVPALQSQQQTQHLPLSLPTHESLHTVFQALQVSYCTARCCVFTLIWSQNKERLLKYQDEQDRCFACGASDHFTKECSVPNDVSLSVELFCVWF